MTNKEIKLLTIDEEPNFKNCICIVCRKNHAEIVLDMGCHQTQLCKDCLQRLKHKLMEKQVRASSNSDEDCISRAELLKAIDKWDKFGVDDTNSLFRLDNLSLPHYVPYIHYNDVVKAIKGMPSVQPKSMQVELEGNGYSDGELVYDYGKCPKCGWEFEYGEKDWEEPYCCHCGQRLKWFESEDKE